MSGAAGRSADWHELRGLLHEKVVLRPDSSHPLRGLTGRPLPWVAYVWSITLGADGAQLAARCLLEKLRDFGATQLASHGYTSLPLVTSCVLVGNGHYTGLSVRHERKTYGSGRLIDGDGDRDRPVVLVDDCLVSGRSFYRAASALEAEGYQVEGMVCLMHFPGRGGRSWAEAHGYRVEPVFDVWEDLRLPRPPGPSWCFPPAARPSSGVEEHSRPAEFARRAAQRYLATGTVPAPAHPVGHDAGGGIFVSIRDRRSGERLARRGFFRLPSADPGGPQELADVTADAVDAARSAIGSTGFGNLAFGVTQIGTLEPVLPRDLDVTRYGIVVHSEAEPWRIGAALPNTESATTEIEQYREACTKARIVPGEPHALYRHPVTKDITDGAAWPPFGAAMPEASLPDADLAALSARLWDLIGEASGGSAHPGHADEAGDVAGSREPLPLPPFGVDAVAVALYAGGQLCGCWVKGGGTLGDSLAGAVRGAWRDPRFAGRRAGARPGDMVVLLSLLHHRQQIGPCDTAKAVPRFRLGLDTVAAIRQDGDGTGGYGFILSHVPCHYDWSAERTLQQAARKAGSAGDAHHWRTYQTASWLCRPGRPPRPLSYGFPARPARGRHSPDHHERAARLLGEHVAGQIGGNGLPAYCYFPVYDSAETAGSAARVILSLGALHEAGVALGDAGFRAKGRDGLHACLRQVRATGGRHSLQVPGLTGGAGAECLLLAALASAAPQLLRTPAAGYLIANLETLFHPDGAISRLPPGRRRGTDDELLPGAVLLAAARVERVTGAGPLTSLLDRNLAWYRRRFRARPSWAMVGWHAQAWTAIHELTDRREHAAFVFELADWALDRQLRRNGAFLTDLWHDGPSFHTACVAEGVADAWRLAGNLADRRRARRYAASWRAAMDFMDTLIVRPGDTFCMPNPQAAVGGVRHSPASTQLRIDYTGHLLTALAKGVTTLARSAGSEPCPATR